MWELDCEESWVPKNWCFWTMVLEESLESPLDCKEIQPVNLKGNQPWIIVGRTNAEAETPVFWPSDLNRWLIGKVPDVGKDWGQKEKKVSENEMAEWAHQCNGHELGQTLGDGEGTERPGVLQSMGSQTVRHHWVEPQTFTSLSTWNKSMMNLETEFGIYGSSGKP